MKLRVHCEVSLHKTIEVDIQPSEFDAWKAGAIHDERADTYADKVSEALPSFSEWDEANILEEVCYKCDSNQEPTNE